MGRGCQGSIGTSEGTLVGFKSNIRSNARIETVLVDLLSLEVSVKW